jgi:hypothetical protein
MSDQCEGAVTSLEQMFLSREFEDARDRSLLLENRTEDADVQELPGIGSSEEFGRPPHRSRSMAQAGGELPPPLRLEDTVVAMLPTVPRESSRHRFIAAASGIAAAALVVAGLASGSAQQGRGDISAQGSGASGESSRAGSHLLPGGGSRSPSTLSPGRAGASAAQAASSGPGGPAALLAAGPAQAGQSGPPPAVTVEVPPGTTVTAVPVRAGPQSGPPGSGAGGSSGSPAPARSGSGSPTAPVVVVGNTATTVGSAATTTANQAAGSVTAATPSASAPGGGGAAVTGLGQNLSSTTA